MASIPEALQKLRFIIGPRTEIDHESTPPEARNHNGSEGEFSWDEERHQILSSPGLEAWREEKARLIARYGPDIIQSNDRG